MSNLRALEMTADVDVAELRDAVRDAEQAIEDLEDAFERINNATVEVSIDGPLPTDDDDN